MAEQTVIIDVTLNAQDATQKAKDLGNSIKAIREEQKALKAQGKENDVAFQSNKASLSQLNAEQKAYIQIANAAEGSNNQLRAQLAILTQQYNALGKAERDSTVAGQSLQLQIRGISDELKKNESAVGDNRRNVGNYKDALTQSNDATGQAISANKQLLSSLAPNTIGFQLGANAIDTAKAHLQAFRQATQEAKEAQTAYQQAQIISTQATEASNIATEQATAIGFKFTQGEATQAEVIAANTLATDANIVATGAQTAATEAQVVATNTATSAMKIFKVALASTGIGAILILVATLVSYLSSFDPLIDTIEQLFSGFKAGIDAVGRIITGFITNIKSVGDLVGKLGNFFAHPIDSIKSFGKAVADAAVAAAKLKEAQQDLADQQNAQEVINARAEQQIKQLILQSKNRTISDKQRQAFLKQAEDLENKTFAQRSKLIEKDNNNAVEAARIKGNLNAQEIKKLKEFGIEYAIQLQNRGKLSDDEVENLKKAQLARIGNLEESTQRLEKIQNRQDESAKRAADAEEKRQAKAQALKEKGIEAEQARLESVIKTNESIQTQRKNEEDAVNRDIDEKVAKYKKYGKTTEQLELERTSRLKEINKQYNESIAKSTQDVLDKVAEIYINRIADRNDRELAQIAFQNEKKLALIDADILATQERIALGEEGLTELMVAQQSLRDATVSENQSAIDAKNLEIQNEKNIALDEDAKRQIEREQSVLEAKIKIQEEERKLTDDGLKLLEDVFGKETAIGKAAFLAQKAFAIARVIIDTQAALAANVAAQQARAVWLSVIPFGQIAIAADAVASQIARTKIIIGAAIAAGTIASTAVAGFSDGVIGFNSDGQGSMVRGKGTSKSDSINARLSNGESVINARSTAMYAPLLSMINEMGGGRPLSAGYAMAQGGIAQGGFVSKMNDDFNNQIGSANIIINAIKALPNPVVSVEQILSAEQVRQQVAVQQNL